MGKMTSTPSSSPSPFPRPRQLLASVLTAFLLLAVSVDDTAASPFFPFGGSRGEPAKPKVAIKRQVDYAAQEHEQLYKRQQQNGGSGGGNGTVITMR